MKQSGPRLVNPEDRPVKEKIPYKTIIVTTVIGGTAGFILAKVLDHLWEKGKKANPFAVNPMNQNPALAGAVGPQAFQSPYSQLAQTQGLPFAPPEAPVAPSPSAEDEPPKWAQAFIEAHGSRITSLEQRMGPAAVPSEDETAA